MLSVWHSTILGQFDQGGLIGGLDYGRLFLDPIHARGTWIHEVVHGTLCTTTEFGQATTVVFRLLPKLKSFPEKEKKYILQAFREKQLFLQEGSATLLQVLYLASKMGKKEALEWAKKELPDDYYVRLNYLLFVFKMSSRYRDEFTRKIPHLALCTGIRKKITELELFDKPKDFIAFLNDPENIPDVRFKKLVNLIKQKPHLVLKSPEELCSLAGITAFPDPSKQDVADFLNYSAKIIGKKVCFKAEDIGDVKEGQEAIMAVNDKIIVGNMNLAQSLTREFLWEMADFLHYADKIEAVIISEFSTDLDELKVGEMITGRKHEVGIMGFLKGGYRYSIGMDRNQAEEILNNQMKGKTLIVKWGLYKPGDKHISSMPRSPQPSVVIYNSVRDLDLKMAAWLPQHSASYIHIGISKDHVFNTFILKDEDGVLHLVNSIGNKDISEFLNKYGIFLQSNTLQEIVNNPEHYNNTVSIWMNLPWNIDWFRTMAEQDKIVPR